MTTAEVLKQSKDFTDELVKQLTDKNIELNKKQVYFMDSHPKIQACMQALQQIISNIKNSENETSDDDLQTLNNASAILTNLQSTITLFQKELMIADTVQEDDLAPTKGLTAENVQEAFATNETTKSIVKDMNDIIKNQSPTYTHCLVCDDGSVNMFTANTKDEINKFINDIAAANNYSNVQLFKMTFIPVPINKKTILSV